MINEKKTRLYCSEDPTLIENYWDAVNDETQVWDCHHKNEIFRGVGVSPYLLMDIGLYYKCPADELIFLTRSEHKKLHYNVKPMRTETKVKIGEANSGENNGFYGKKHSEESCKKMSEAHKGKPRSKETCKKISEAKKSYWAKRRAKQ